MGKSRVTRQYDEGQRRGAVELAERLGAAAAARELGLPKGTVSCWLFLARRAASGGETVAQAGSEEAEGSGGRGEDGGAGGESADGDGSAPPAASAPSRPAVAAPGPPTVPAPSPATTPASSRLTSGAPPKKGPTVAKVYTPSQRAEILEHAAKHGPVATERKFGVSRYSIREWRRKVARAAAGEATTSPVAGPDGDPKEERDRRILAEWRKHPGLGPSQIRNQLRRQAFKVSTSTVRRVMEEHGYVPPKSRRREADGERYEAVRPNQLWHMDFLHRHIHKQRIYVLLFVDDFSRYIVGGALWDGESAAAVIEAFEAAVSRHGRPESVMSDGGSAFYAWRGVSQFTRLLEELDVEQLIAKRPETNGKLEVLNANIQKELFNVETFFDLGETQRRFKAWISFYNFRRTHHALGGLLVPADRYFGRADEVLAHIEAGRPPDGVGEPLPANERVLDLFRVTSRNGQLEIWLMGQRLGPLGGK